MPPGVRISKKAVGEIKRMKMPGAISIMIPVSTDAASNYADGPSEHVSVRHRLVVRLLSSALCW